MLDIQKIRENKAEIEKALKKRVPEINLDEILELDKQRRDLIAKLDNLKAEKNKHSKTKPSLEIIEEMKKIGVEIKILEEKFNDLDKKFKEELSSLPNIPAADVLAGGKENNEVISTYGKKPQFSFKIKDHMELAQSLNLIDYQRATKMSGAGFWAYVGQGAELEWALWNYFKDFHQKNGYKFLLLPYLLNQESAYASGHLPKFKEDLFWTNNEQLCLNATSEMMLLNYHRDEILKQDLPLKYYAFSPCFRKEAGAYRTKERGIMRGHQFNKIEMFHFAEPVKSEESFNELLKNAEKLVQGLGLHFQTSKLAAQDTSATMAKTIDLEVYFPSIDIYKEVSSVSNALDYQARRANIKYQDEQGNKKFVHTLNASGLATSRILPAILEQNQQADGSVKIPKVLRKYLNFKILKSRIEK